MKLPIFISALLLLVCCRTSREVSTDIIEVHVRDTIERIRHDSVFVSRDVVRHDSVFMRDSVFVMVDSAGNRTREVWHWRYDYQSSDAQATALRIENEVLRHERDSIASASSERVVVKEQRRSVWKDLRSYVIVFFLATFFSFMLFTIKSRPRG